ncbi:MAG: hypothetical protein KGD63_00295 [Candidatus Lokiarchaeota archaeon]|nr:hypothetical protein [Candidatus Lokiarchaeota archaeon]
MINDKFLKNWLKILDYNKKINEFPEQGDVLEEVRIPFTPIEVEAHLLYNFFKYIYPEIINDQQNILDIIISKDQKKILDIILYETKEPGVPDSYKKLNPNLLKSRKFSTEKLEESFFYIQKRILKKKEIRISHIRIFNEEFIRILNNQMQNADNISFHDFFLSFLEIIEKSIREKLLFICPKPNLLSFLEELLNFLNQFQLPALFNIFSNYFFKENGVIIFYSEKFSFIVELKKNNNKKSNYNIKFYNPKDIGIDFNNIEKKDILKQVNNKFKKTTTYLIEQGQILRILNELFEFEIPIQKDKLRLFLQKLLFQFRSFETNWYKYPRPKIYGTFRRFLIQLFGFNYNLKKISHWAIPELLFKSDLFFGMNNRIIFIITNLNPNNNSKDNNNIALLLETEKNSLTNLQHLSMKDFGEKFSITHIEKIRNELSEQYGFINAIIKIDKILIDLFINNFLFKFTKFQLFSKLKTIKAIKNEKYFAIYPEIPIYKFIKNSRPLKLFKTILPILIDKHEF